MSCGLAQHGLLCLGWGILLLHSSVGLLLACRGRLERLAVLLAVDSLCWLCPSITVGVPRGGELQLQRCRATVATTLADLCDWCTKGAEELPQ